VPRGVTIRSVPAEAALGLTADFAGWRRGLAVVALAFSSFAIWRITHSYTQTLDAYVTAAGLAAEKSSPLFRTAAAAASSSPASG
jgi:hypothetical protein